MNAWTTNDYSYMDVLQEILLKFMNIHLFVTFDTICFFFRIRKFYSIQLILWQWQNKWGFPFFEARIKIGKLRKTQLSFLTLFRSTGRLVPPSTTNYYFWTIFSVVYLLCECFVMKLNDYHKIVNLLDAIWYNFDRPYRTNDQPSVHVFSFLCVPRMLF